MGQSGHHYYSLKFLYNLFTNPSHTMKLIFGILSTLSSAVMKVEFPWKILKIEGIYMKLFLQLGTFSLITLMSVQITHAKEQAVDPMTSAYISTMNTMGAMKYCASKGFINGNQMSNFGDAMSMSKMKLSEEVIIAGEQASIAGERGIVFHFTKNGKKNLMPVVSMEALAKSGGISLKSLCETYTKAINPTNKTK
ncbi:hypothetical protein [Acinetobacter guillouiae]|uniref:hypothetical protein n=1 Tax=Acinetobacter guillouiae TaxID=106649 RepID=UPI002FDA35DC